MSGLSVLLQQQNKNKGTTIPPTATTTSTSSSTTTTTTTTRSNDLPSQLSISPKDKTMTDSDPSSITVYGAASGIVVDLKLSSTDTVTTLQEQIALSLHVEPSNQILLLTSRNNHASSGSSWIQSSSSSLKTYNLPSTERVIYLFDRRLLSRRSSTPESVTIAAKITPVPQDSSTLEALINAHMAESESAESGAGSTSPTRRPSLSSSGRSAVTFASLQATLLQFELHLRQVKTCAANGKARFQTFINSYERQHVSLSALDVATQNLNDLMTTKKGEFTRLWEKKHAMMEKHGKELENFSTCLERLKQIPLHPALSLNATVGGGGEQQRQTLWDCVPVAKLQSWASDCRERHESLRNEPSIELERTYKEVLRSVEDDILSPTSNPSLAVKSHRNELEKLKLFVESTMGSSQIMMKSIQSIVQTFEDDFDWIKNVVLSGNVDRTSASALAKEAIDRGDSHFALLKEVSELSGGDKLTIENEEEMESNDVDANKSTGEQKDRSSNENTLKWKSIFEQCTTLENSCRRMFHQSLRAISEKQHRIAKSLSNKMSAFHAQLKAQDKNINYLVDVRRVPKVYVAFLLEIARRNRSTSHIKAELRAANLRLNRLREQEMEHRETFIRRHGRAVVADLVPAVANVRPMSIDVRERLSESDESLPNIDLDERTIDVYHKLGEDMAALVTEVREESEGMLGIMEEKVHNDVVLKGNSGIPSPIGQQQQQHGIGGDKIDWERRCIELEYCNAQLRASIVSENVGHNEMKLPDQKIYRKEKNSENIIGITRSEDGLENESALQFFPSLMVLLKQTKERENALIERLREVEASQFMNGGDNTNVSSTSSESSVLRKDEVDELKLKLETSEQTLKTERAESIRLRNEIIKYKALYENECMKAKNALHEARDVQKINLALLSASQSSQDKDDQNKNRLSKHVEELKGSVLSLKAQHEEDIKMRESLLNQTTLELTEQIIKERKRTEFLLSASVFWRTTDDAIEKQTNNSGEKEEGNTSEDKFAIESLEYGFLSVIREGRLHLMFQKHTSGEIFRSAGGGLKGRDRLYIAVLPRSENQMKRGSVYHCVLSDDIITQLESAQALTDVIIANVVELRPVNFTDNDKVKIFVATAGEIFHPKLA